MGTAFLWGQGGGGLDADGATAAPADVVKPYTFIGSGSDELQTGTIEDVTQDLSLPINGKVMIPAGYHDGTGKVKQSLTDNGAKEYTLSANGKVMIPAGWHNGAGKVSQSLTLFGGGTYTPTAAGVSIDTANKYLSGNIVAKGDANLKSANIAAKMWGITAGFTPLENALTLYNGGTYSGWWKDGVVARSAVQKESSRQSAAPLLTAVAQATNISTADFRNGIGLTDSERSASTATAATKPTFRIQHQETDINAHLSSGYYFGGAIGYKTVDLSLFSTLTVRYTINKMSAIPTYMGGLNYERVRPVVGLARNAAALTSGGTAAAIVDANNTLIEAGPGANNVITNRSGSITVNVASYTGHWFIIPLFIIKDYQGATNGNADYVTDITVDSIILGK